MLVLTRKDGERIVITDTQTGEEIAVSVVRIGHWTVRLGIDASKRFEIVRAELREPVATADNANEER